MKNHKDTINNFTMEESPDYTWEYDKKVEGFITIIHCKKYFSLAVSDAECGTSGKVIASFGEVGGKYEKETINDITRAIDCINYFAGICDVNSWIELHPREDWGEK